MRFQTAGSIAGLLLLALPLLAQQPPQTPLQRLQASGERPTRRGNALGGI